MSDTPIGPTLVESTSVGSGDPPTAKGSYERIVDPDAIATYSVPVAPAGTVIVVAPGMAPPAVVVTVFEVLPPPVEQT
jgi:hypothetical protein